MMPQVQIESHGQTVVTHWTICGAKTRKGTPCRGKAMANGRCRMHRGNAKSGVNVPSFRHGRYSKYLPLQLAARYRQALDDPDLIVMRDELALLDTRAESILEQMAHGEREEVTGWPELLELVRSRTKVAEQERKRLEALQQTITVSQLMVLIAAVVDTVRRNVEDRDAVGRIVAELDRLLHRGDPGRAANG